MILHSMDRSKPPLREDCFIDTGYIRCPPILFTVLSPQWEGIVPFEVDILLDFFHDYYTEKFVNKIKLPIHITDINTTKTKMKRFIQQLLSVQVYRGKFPVLHLSSRARHCTLDRHLLILGLCNRKENPQSPKPCWQNSLSQSLGPMICGPHTQKTAWTYLDTQKKQQHSTPQSTTLISLNLIISQWL